MTGYKVSPLTLYDGNSVAIDKMTTKELPKPPIAITGTNEFGYIEIQLNGRAVFVSPADVKHNLVYCSAGAPARRGAGEFLGGVRPIGARKGAAGDDLPCIPRD
ncbi:MAG: hypothetical protein WBR13_01755 [Allosphingosinicella sp.]